MRGWLAPPRPIAPPKFRVTHRGRVCCVPWPARGERDIERQSVHEICTITCDHRCCFWRRGGTPFPASYGMQGRRGRNQIGAAENHNYLPAYTYVPAFGGSWRLDKTAPDLMEAPLCPAGIPTCLPAQAPRACRTATYRLLAARAVPSQYPLPIR
jgi:hypothetical protein